jgi:hypothetical protein
VIQGKLPNKAARIVRQWALDHRAELMANWRRGVSLLPMEMIPGADLDDQTRPTTADRPQHARTRILGRKPCHMAAADLLARDTVMTRPLTDPDYFARAFIEAGALAWPNGLELSAFSLHRRLAEAGALIRPAA